MKKLFFALLALLLAAIAALAALIYRWTLTPYGRINPAAAVLWRLLSINGDTGITDDTLLETRRRFDMVRPRIPLPSVVDKTIPGPDGPLSVRIYHPGGDQPLPVMVYFHGGGFAVGSIASHENVTRRIARDAQVVVVSVDYRLAPEHPYPAALDDAYAAAQWVSQHAAKFGGDPRRIAVGGDSAGGNLAAAVSLKARDVGEPTISLQVLIYPALSMLDEESESRQRHEGYVLSRQDMEQFRIWYLPDENQWRHPYASPLKAEELTGLPAACVLTAAFDPLRDDGEAYARRLREAGVPTVYRDYAGMLHGFLSFGDAVALLPGGEDRLLPAAAEAYRDIATAVAQTLTTAQPITPA